MRLALLAALLLACRPDADDTGDTSDTGDSDSADTSDTGDTSDTSDTTDTTDTAVCPDADGDGYCDAIDTCDGPGADDTDGDGTCDDADPCFGTGPDSDADGVCDGLDDCTGDDASGDLDGDGTCDDLDACYGVGADTDGDGLCDDLDLCAGDNTTGDDDGDGVCDGSDPCVGPRWCWNVSLTVTGTTGTTALNGLIGATLTFSLGVEDDLYWDYSAGSLARTTPDVLSASGSNAAAQDLIDTALGDPRVTLLSTGQVEVLWDPAGACQDGETALSFFATGTGWTFHPVDETVTLGAGAPSTTAEIRRVGSCPTVAAEATGPASLVAIDGIGAP